MRRNTRHTPTILALVALAFSLGVGTFAAASHLHVTRSDIAANAVTGPKVARDSISGKDIREMSLGTVPNADAVKGVSIARFRRRTQPQSGSPQSIVVRMAGLTIKSECILVQPDIGFPRLFATTSADHAVIQASVTKGVYGSNGDSYRRLDTDFRPNEPLMLTDVVSEAVISFTYRVGRHVVDGVVSLSYQGPTCKIDGTARGG